MEEICNISNKKTGGPTGCRARDMTYYLLFLKNRKIHISDSATENIYPTTQTKAACLDRMLLPTHMYIMMILAKSVNQTTLSAFPSEILLVSFSFCTFEDSEKVRIHSNFQGTTTKQAMNLNKSFNK